MSEITAPKNRGGRPRKPDALVTVAFRVPKDVADALRVLPASLVRDVLILLARSTK